MVRGSCPTRRAVLRGGAALTAVALAGCTRETTEISTPLPGRLPEIRVGGSITLNAAERALTLPGRTAATPAWLYGAEPFPVLRIGAGERLDATLINGLAEHSSIHWHGVRVPNAMDGVPFLTQLPVKAGESFAYGFTPPNPGLNIFHPHCNTVEQFGRGLAGVLIVEGDESEPYDDDVLCVLKDWRVGADGEFLPLLTDMGAGRAGSFGSLRTTNGRIAPEIAVAAGANIRLRLVNLDSTRIGEIGLEGAAAHVIAVDGTAVPPFPLETWRLGPAMRLELTLRTPAAGRRVTLFDYFAAEPVVLATLATNGAAKRSDAFSPAALKASTLPEPDLATARVHRLSLGASAQATSYAEVAPIILPDGTRIDVMDSLCSTTRTFWAIDGKTWPQGDRQGLPPPFAKFSRGETVVLDLVNTTKQPHPMHLHGHIFKVLSGNRLPRPVHWADTVLVMPDERVQIAFVADNPGNWMMHCHIIEHQDTGMMAWFAVA